MDPITMFFTEKAVKYLMKQGPNLVEKLATDAEEAKKHCAVCGEYIKGGAKFNVTRRFYCARCRHRTHVHCAGNLKAQLCERCAP